MRAPTVAIFVLTMGLTVGRAAAAPVADPLGDPKCARGECRPVYFPPLDVDDPKLALGFRRPVPVAHVELGYRYMAIADPYHGGLPFHLVELDGYPIDHYFRLGLSLTGGASTRESAWLIDIGLSLGVQYPARVTPFFDFRFAAGVVGADIVSQKVVTYELRPVLEAGINIFLKKSLHLIVAVGWAHPIYGGVDANKIQAEKNAGETPVYDVHNVGYDTVTVRASVGL